jgi:hypothetical protein
MRRISPLVTLLFAVMLHSARAESEVTISLENGRTLTGEVDSRSDSEALWLRRTEGNVILTSAIAWDRVVSAEENGKPIASQKLLQVLRASATAEPADFLTEFEPNAIPLPLRGASLAIPPRVVSLEIDAGLVNLDRTVEPDGLTLVLAAIDAMGQSVPVRGSLSARLIVERLNFHTGEVSFEEFQRWTSPVSPANFYEGVAEMPLRFRRASPEFDWELCTAALVNVRLSVYGEGNFEASIPVQIQQYNPIRDELRNQQGERFFRNELTHNTRQDGPRNLHRGYSSQESIAD